MARGTRSRTRRSPLEWGIRGILALGVAVLGWTSVTHSLALAIVDQDPARAHGLAPGDGRITARLAEARFLDSQTKNVPDTSGRLAQRALMQDPTAVRAVATLGLQAQSRGDTPQARRVFAYAETLSRRHLPTQLWAIEDAVARGDISGTLRNYDIALRTSKTAPDLLFPVLGSAIANPAIRSQLLITLSKKPAWAPSFMTWVSSNDVDPRANAALFLGLQHAGMPLPPEATAAAVQGLIAAGSVDQAWNFYATMRKGVDRHLSRDPRFTADLSAPSRFDWQPANDQTIVTSIQHDQHGGIFDFSVSPSGGGTLVQQMQILPAGAYRIEGHSTGIEQPDVSLPYWVLTCANGHELGRVVIPNSTQARGNFAGRFVVPGWCSVQTLALMARPSDQIGGVVGQIDRVRLMPTQ